MRGPRFLKVAPTALALGAVYAVLLLVESAYFAGGLAGLFGRRTTTVVTTDCAVAMVLLSVVVGLVGRFDSAISRRRALHTMLWSCRRARHGG